MADQFIKPRACKRQRRELGRHSRLP